MGTRYRDLIDAADSIIYMRTLVNSILDIEKKVEDDHKSLSSFRRQNIAKQRDYVIDANGLPKLQNGPNTEKDFQQQKFEVGKKIKILVDTPEAVKK